MVITFLTVDDLEEYKKLVNNTAKILVETKCILSDQREILARLQTMMIDVRSKRK